MTDTPTFTVRTPRGIERYRRLAVAVRDSLRYRSGIRTGGKPVEWTATSRPNGAGMDLVARWAK